jgi:hypothetical protein
VVVRVPQAMAGTARTLPVTVKVTSSRAGERVIQTTFKTATDTGDGVGP